MSSYLARAKAMLRSNDPVAIAAVKAANDHLFSLKLLGPSAVHNNGTLSSLSVQYSNEAFIGQMLMPVKRVSKLSDTYFLMGKRDRRGIMANAEVGVNGSVNQLDSETRTTATYSCQPYAIKDYVDELTLRNQDAPLDEMLDLTAAINDSLDLMTEQKIATVMTTSTNFATANTATLSGSNQWNSSTGGSLILNIQTAIDAIEVGPGATKLVAYCGTEVARTIQRHPAMLDMFKYNADGLVPLKQVASWFGLDDILVGKARKDTANSNQTEVSARVWGKHFGIARVATNPGPRTACFGLTFRFGDKETTQWFDQAPGFAGGYWSKVGIADDYKVIANDCGFLYVDAVA